MAKRQTYLNGLFTQSSPFATPNLGSEGNEKVNRFRNPGFAEVDAALLKDIPLLEHVKLQLRAEAFNVLNHVNLQGIDSNMADGTFGRTTSQYQPRWFQFAARLFF